MTTRQQAAADRAIDRQIETLYYRYAAGIHINVLDIPRFFSAARRAVAEGRDLEQTVIGLIDVYRQN